MRQNHKGNLHSPYVSLTVLKLLKLDGESSGGLLVAPISVIVEVLELPKGPGARGQWPWDCWTWVPEPGGI